VNQLKTRLSIGLPVYNGENYLVEAIDSILEQSYDDFELVITDNASTDRTSEICQDYAARDTRIRYHRNPENVGSGPNFDMAFKLSSGSEYFKWAAHDDVLSPTFLERCVSTLDEDPDAVLCQSLVALIDSKGNVTDIHDPNLRGTRSTRASDRFAPVVLQVHMTTDFFGVIRRTALEGAPLMSDYVNGDHVLLAVLALRGRFIQIREPLFQNRSHPQRDSEDVAYHERAASWDRSKVGKIQYPLWRQYGGFVREMRRQDLSFGNRLRCYGHLAHWWLVNWNILRMAVDIIGSHYPPAYPFARRIKHRIFGRKNLGFDWERWRGDDPT
jgi:glycosyltransferase involved in cell wall biosynthesis